MRWEGIVYDGDGVKEMGTGKARYTTKDAFGTINFDFTPAAGSSYAIKDIVADAEL